MFPVNASVLSAFGTLVSPIRIDLARSLPRRLTAVDPAERDALFDELARRGPRVLAAAGARDDTVQFRYGVDLRYAGQGNEVTVWVGEGDSWPVDAATVQTALRGGVPAHLRPDDPRRRGRGGHLAPRRHRRRRPGRAAAGRSRPRAPSLTGADPVVFVRDTPPVDTPVYGAASLGVGARFDGPAIVEERETTAVIRPGWSVEVGADGSLIATR